MLRLLILGKHLLKELELGGREGEEESESKEVDESDHFFQIFEILWLYFAVVGKDFGAFRLEENLNLSTKAYHED